MIILIVFYIINNCYKMCKKKRKNFTQIFMKLVFSCKVKLFYCLIICSQNNDLDWLLCMMSDLEGKPVVMVSFGSNNRLSLETILKKPFERGRSLFCSGNWALVPDRLHGYSYWIDYRTLHSLLCKN